MGIPVADISIIKAQDILCWSTKEIQNKQTKIYKAVLNHLPNDPVWAEAQLHCRNIIKVY